MKHIANDKPPINLYTSSEREPLGGRVMVTMAGRCSSSSSTCCCKIPDIPMDQL